jgi:hypothetical protein
MIVMLGDVAVDPGGQLDHRAEAASRAGQSHNPTQGLVARGRLDGLAGGVPQQPLDPGLEKRRYQRPDRWRTEPGARAACFWGARLRSATSTIICRDLRTYILSRATRIKHPSPLGNPLSYQSTGDEKNDRRFIPYTRS